MNQEQLGGLIRTILAAGGGYFVAKGAIDQATMVAVTGALATIFTAGWSMWAKRTPKADPAA